MTRHVDISVIRIQRALSRIENDYYTPVRASTEVPAYLDDLKCRFSDDEHPFNSFVSDLSVDELTDELLAQSLPRDQRDAIIALRTEHHELQLQKESEIAKAIFDNARNYRDRQEKLANSLAELIEGVEFVATPSVINSALVTLGFDANLLPPHNSG